MMRARQAIEVAIVETQRYAMSLDRLTPEVKRALRQCSRRKTSPSTARWERKGRAPRASVDCVCPCGARYAPAEAE